MPEEQSRDDARDTIAIRTDHQTELESISLRSMLSVKNENSSASALPELGSVVELPEHAAEALVRVNGMTVEEALLQPPLFQFFQ